MKQQEHSAQNQKKQQDRLQQPKELSKNYSKESSDNCSFDISIQVSENLPQISLSFIHKPQGHYKIRIPMYNVSSFLKMQTQMYLIDVQDPFSQTEYQIERRFSDFVEYYEAVFYNHPGHILSPFPDKNLQTFFKVKLGIGIHDAGEKCQIIEKRMSDLQIFVNNIAKDEQLSKCDQIKVFLEKNPKVYGEMKSQLLAKVRENQDLQKTSYFSSIKQTGKSIWNYLKRQKNSSLKQQFKMTFSKHSFQFTQISQKILQNIKGIQEIQILIQKLYYIQSKSSEFVALQTQNDSIQEVFAKINSSQDYCKDFSNHLEIIVEKVKYLKKQFEEASKVTQYRLKLMKVLENKDADKIPMNTKQKIKDRMQNLQQIFLGEWHSFNLESDEKFQSIIDEVHKKWKNHKKNMRKIWRKKDSSKLIPKEKSHQQCS